MTRSGKKFSDLVCAGSKQAKDVNSEDDGDIRQGATDIKENNEAENLVAKSKSPKVQKETKKVKPEVTQPLSPIRKPPPPFPQRLKKK